MLYDQMSGNQNTIIFSFILSKPAGKNILYKHPLMSPCHHLRAHVNRDTYRQTCCLTQQMGIYFSL